MPYKMKLTAIYLLSSVAIFFLAGCGATEQEESQFGRVQFPDPHLESAMRDILKIPEGPIYRSDLIVLRRLFLSGRGIADLSGIEYCTNLEELGLNDNRISDITPLEKLIKLHTLWLRNNQVSDISPLKELSRLQRLDLGGNRISDIRPLCKLFWLWQLWLNDNRISDISPLLSNLGIGKNDRVDLRGNPLNDEAYDIYIPALQERGVRLLYDPRP